MAEGDAGAGDAFAARFRTLRAYRALFATFELQVARSAILFYHADAHYGVAQLHTFLWRQVRL